MGSGRLPTGQAGPAWVNGRLVGESEPSLSLLERGLTLGDGVFETILAAGTKLFRPTEHLERLARGASLLAIDLPPAEQLLAAMLDTLSANQLSAAVVRLTVSRGPDSGRGLDVSPDIAPTVIVRVSPHELRTPGGAGLAAVFSPIRRNESSPLSRVKCLSYADNVLARLEARRRGADDAVLLNTAGEVCCASAANLFVVKGGTLTTPPGESGALPGVTRHCVLELAAARRLTVREAPVLPDDLWAADEAFLTNTVTGVAGLTSVEGRSIGTGRLGEVTRLLAADRQRLVDSSLAMDSEGRLSAPGQIGGQP
ncbi:MAG TPA: aminotransferase class IV [Dehalococcoidia bacterium]|nr:aminotransferase class IV [Dehalococcoidia bacterium]